MTNDEQHLDLLSVLHYVLGPLVALFSCMFLLHVAMGIAMLCGKFEPNGPPRAFAWIFVLFPSTLVLGGWTIGGLLIAAGYKLKRRASHTFCIVVAGIECILMPLGTVLGVFTLVILMKDSVKALFGGVGPPPVPVRE